MFEQYVADGANLFIAIVACLIGFVSAVGFLDFKKTQSEAPEGED